MDIFEELELLDNELLSSQNDLMDLLNLGCGNKETKHVNFN